LILLLLHLPNYVKLSIFIKHAKFLAVRTHFILSSLTIWPSLLYSTNYTTMNGKLTCQQRPKYPKYISSVNYFTLIPEEIILLIISILGSLNCRQLSMTSQLLRNFFTYYIVPCISNKTKIDFQLADSYAKDGSPFSLKPTYIPQFLILKNSYQLMKYKKNYGSSAWWLFNHWFI